MNNEAQQSVNRIHYAYDTLYAVTSNLCQMMYTWRKRKWKFYTMPVQFADGSFDSNVFLNIADTFGFKFGCLISIPASKQSLQWRNNECDGVSNHRRIDCYLSRLFKSRSKKTSKLRVTGLCDGNSPVAGKFPAQRASNAEKVSIWWYHHVDHHLSAHCPLAATCCMYAFGCHVIFGVPLITQEYRVLDCFQMCWI